MADTPMVNLTIEGRPVSVAAGTTILEAAKLAGVLIPHYCQGKLLGGYGSHRRQQMNRSIRLSN